MTTFTEHDLRLGNHLYFERGELLDDLTTATLNERPFYRHDSLAEIREQIRLIETITPEAQAEYFDPRTPEQRDLDEWQQDWQDTYASAR